VFYFQVARPRALRVNSPPSPPPCTQQASTSIRSLTGRSLIAHCLYLRRRLLAAVILHESFEIDLRLLKVRFTHVLRLHQPSACTKLGRSEKAKPPPTRLVVGGLVYLCTGPGPCNNHLPPKHQTPCYISPSWADVLIALWVHRPSGEDQKERSSSARVCLLQQHLSSAK
jgi:hypothetical protein